MKTKAPFWLRLILFLAWPIIAPIFLLCAALTFIIGWPFILTSLEFEENKK